MELKENHHNNSSSNNNKSKRIIIKEEIDEGAVEAIVEIVVVVVEMDVEMETETETTRTTIIMVVVEMEMVVVLRKRNVEDVIGEEIEKVAEMEEEVVEGIITMVEIPSKVMVVEEEINRRMAKHLENIEYTRCFEGDFLGT